MTSEDRAARQRAEAERTKPDRVAELAADLEGPYQRAAWSLTTEQAADLANVNAYPLDGVRISGDHRPCRCAECRAEG